MKISRSNKKTTENQRYNKEKKVKAKIKKLKNKARKKQFGKNEA